MGFQDCQAGTVIGTGPLTMQAGSGVGGAQRRQVHLRGFVTCLVGLQKSWAPLGTNGMAIQSAASKIRSKSVKST